MKISILFFILCFILTACSDSIKHTQKDEHLMNWETIRIESRDQTIIIDKREDYGVRDTCDFKEAKIDKYRTEYRPINRGQENFNITQQEKDSLFKYVYDIVSNPVYTDQYATCYVGNISISFSIGNTTQICKYNSVGNWTTISRSTERLYHLLSKKTKILEY
ncbi:MAG: hypothetical protein ACK5MK_14710 [Dysgonomonas sp.]